MTLFDVARERDEAIERVAEHAGDQWRAYALDFVRAYLRTHAELFGDDLWDAGLARPHDQRALGAVIKSLRKAGLIAPTGQMRQRRSGHLSPAPVWRSLIFEDGA
jgi:phytoene dehydrogenase-like protein